MRASFKIVEQSKRGLMKAIRLFCSTKDLALRIGISKQRINYWKSSDVLMPYEIAIKIFVATNGQISIYELRPDLADLTRQYESMIVDQYLKN